MDPMDFKENNDFPDFEDCGTDQPKKKNKNDREYSTPEKLSPMSCDLSDHNSSESTSLLGNKPGTSNVSDSSIDNNLHSVSAPVNVPDPRSGFRRDNPRISGSSPLSEVVSSLLTSPLRSGEVSPDGKIVISSSPIKSGLIFNFSDKQQQILFDLAVIHECNLDRKFLIDPKYEPPKVLLNLLSDKMVNYNWSKLDEELTQNPPKLNEALGLLKDIKLGLRSVLLPWHTRIKEEINEVLDEELIRQEAVNGAFDFNKCASYIITLMAKLCAPVRDEAIAELKKVHGVVPAFKGIFQMLNFMRIDMINYHLIALRSELLRNGQKYEREKFDEFLKVTNGEMPATQNWLLRHGPASSEKDKKSLLLKAFLDFLIWNETAPIELPEPLIHDGHRFSELSEEYYNITFIATSVAVTFANLHGTFILDDSFRTLLKDNLLVLLKGVKCDAHLSRVMPNITEQIVKLIKDRQALNEDQRNNLVQLISEPKEAVRALMVERLNDSLLNYLSNPGHLNLPSSLLYLEEEIKSLALKVSHIVNHSLSVYGDHLYRCIKVCE